MREGEEAPPQPCPCADGLSEIEIALLRAMRRNHELIGQYHKFPGTVLVLQDEIKRGAEAFAASNVRGMEWLTRRMTANLEAPPEWR